MTVTLDDVTCLLDIPIIGLVEEEELDHDHCIELLQDELLYTKAEARAEVKTQCGPHVSYTKLKSCYD